LDGGNAKERSSQMYGKQMLTAACSLYKLAGIQKSALRC